MKVQPAGLGRFFPIVRIIVYCLKIIGLAPFSVGTPTSILNSRGARIKFFRFSKFGLVYNLLITSMCSFFVVLSIKFWTASHSFLQQSSIDRAIIITRISSRSFSTMVIISNWAFRQRNAVRIMNQIFEVGVEIAHLRKQPSNKKFPVFLTIHVIINAFVWITYFTPYDTVSHAKNYNYPNTILNMGSVFVVYWFTVQYFFVVGRIAQDLEAMNKNLLNLEELPSSYVSHSPFANEFLPAFGSQTPKSQLAASRSLISIRAKLPELAQDVEDFFSFPILLCCAVNFFALVFETYHLILRLVSMNSVLLLLPLWKTIGWIFIEIYPLISLSANVTRTEKQAKLTAQIVRKLLARPLGREIKDELEKFSLQLVHEDVRFTANGFFSLDYTFLHSMIAATTTYLVILLQFQSSNLNA